MGVPDQLPFHSSSHDILSPALERAHLSVWKLGASRPGLSDLANENTGCHVQFKFLIGNKKVFKYKHDLGNIWDIIYQKKKKKFLLYLKLRFHRMPFSLPDDATVKVSIRSEASPDLPREIMLVCVDTGRAYPQWASPPPE